MFEQEELKNQETSVNNAASAVSQNSSAPELFNHYEIKNWEFTPRIYKILAASAVFCVSALAFVGQTNLLTVKGCDSPLVSTVCQVIDIVYVGGKMMTTETAFVDKDYEKTSLGDVEITYLDVTSQMPLTYPEGYFALANPEEYAMRQQALEQGFMTNGADSGIYTTPPTGSISTAPFGSSGTDLLGIKPTLPKPNSKSVIGGIPSDPLGGNFGPSYKPTRPPVSRPLGGKIKNSPAKNNPLMSNNSPKGLPPLAGDTAGKPKPTPEEPKVAESKPVTEVELNKRPLVDLGKYVSDLVDKKEVVLDSSFIVGAKGKLNKDGELDPKSFKYTQTFAGKSKEEQKMVEVVQQSIEAINKSGYLKYLAQLSGKDLNLLLQQDNTNLSGEVSSVLESPNRANSIKSALDLAISIVKSKKTGDDASQNDKDDLELLKGATVTVEGSKLTIKFAFPKEIAQGMIKRKLLDQPKDQKPNATALNKDANVNNAK